MKEYKIDGSDMYLDGDCLVTFNCPICGKNNRPIHTLDKSDNSPFECEHCKSEFIYEKLIIELYLKSLPNR